MVVLGGLRNFLLKIIYHITHSSISISNYDHIILRTVIGGIEHHEVVNVSAHFGKDGNSN